MHFYLVIHLKNLRHCAALTSACAVTSRLPVLGKLHVNSNLLQLQVTFL